MNKIYYSLAVLAVAVLLGFGIWKSGVLFPQVSASVLLGEGVTNIETATSTTSAFDISVTEHKDSTDTQGTNLATLHLEGSGSRPENAEDSRDTFTISGSANPVPGVNVDFAADIRLVGEMFYVRLTKVPAIPGSPFDPSLISNVWFSADPVAIAKEYGDAKSVAAMQQVFTDNTAAGAQERFQKIESIYQTHPFVINAAYTGTAKEGGVDVRTISFSIDKDVLADFAVDMQSYLETLSPDTGMTAADLPTKDDIQKILADITFTELTASVGTSDHYLHSFSMKMHIGNDAGSADTSSGDVAFSGTLSDFNKPVLVDAPDSFLPIDKILQLGMNSSKMSASDPNIASDAEIKTLLGPIAQDGSSWLSSHPDYGDFCDAEQESLHQFALNHNDLGWDCQNNSNQYMVLVQRQNGINHDSGGDNGEPKYFCIDTTTGTNITTSTARPDIKDPHCIE